MVLWVSTCCEMGITCQEYGENNHNKHVHSVVKARFPSGKVGSPEANAPKCHFKNFLRQGAGH